MTTEKFDYVLSNLNPLEYCPQVHQGTQRISLNLSEIEKEVDPVLTYKERFELISEIDSKQINARRRRIDEVEEQIKIIKRLKIKDLFEDHKIEISPDFSQQNLLNILLRKGYIGEDYLDYISIFYEGSLSKVDYDFLINMKIQRESEFDVVLVEVENLVKKIDVFEFEKTFVLNYSLVEYILNSNNYNEQKEKLFKQLADESERSVRFVDGYLNTSEDPSAFVMSLSKYWCNLWQFITEQSNYSDEKKYQYFKSVVSFSEINNLVQIFTDYNEVFDKYDDFVLFLNFDKVKQILKALNLKLAKINPHVSDQIIDYIYLNNNYLLNVDTMSFLISRIANQNLLRFNTSNFECIMESKLAKLIEYTNANINKYIESVYLKLELNKDGSEESVAELINRPDITIENKEKIVDFFPKKMLSLVKIQDKNMVNYLLNLSKIEPTWDNLVSAYIINDKSFSDELVNYLNDLGNSDELKKTKIKTDFPDADTASSFMSDLILLSRLNIDSYESVISSIPYIYKKIDLSEISGEKLNVLLKKQKLVANVENYANLKEKFPELAVKLIESNQKKVIEEIALYSFDATDITNLIMSRSLSTLTKQVIILLKDFVFYSTDEKLLNAVSEVLLEPSKAELGEDFTRKVIINSRLTAERKIRMFIRYQNYFDIPNIENFLLSLPEPYSVIAQKGRSPKLDRNHINTELAQILKLKNYISSYKDSVFSDKLIIATKKK